MAADKPNRGVNTVQAGNQPVIVWDRADARSVYANVFNVAGSQEEFVLSFGMNHSWINGQREVKVQLTDRIVMSPFAAKRLARLLNDVIKDFESRFGVLNTEMTRPGTASAQKVPSQEARASMSPTSKASG